MVNQFLAAYKLLYKQFPKNSNSSSIIFLISYCCSLYEDNLYRDSEITLTLETLT